MVKTTRVARLPRVAKKSVAVKVDKAADHGLIDGVKIGTATIDRLREEAYQTFLNRIDWWLMV
jgi:hypothetical protein